MDGQNVSRFSDTGITGMLADCLPFLLHGAVHFTLGGKNECLIRIMISYRTVFRPSHIHSDIITRKNPVLDAKFGGKMLLEATSDDIERPFNA